MVDKLRKTEKNETDFKNIDEGKINEPVLGEEGQFARQKGVRYGQVSVQKDRIEFDDGTQVILRFSGTGGIEAFGEFANVWNFYDTVGGTLYGRLGYLQTSNYFAWYSDGGAGILMSSDHNIFLSANDDVGIYSEERIDINADSSGESEDENAGVYIKGHETESLVNTGVYVYSFDSSDYVEKAAVLKTSKGYRTLYCTESPEVWFMDFCNAKKRKWWQFWKKEKWNVALDPLFREVTEPPYVIMPSLNPDIVQVWGKRKGQADKRFEKKTEKEFKENNKFWQTPQRNANKEI